MTQEKILQYLEAEKRLCRKLIASTNNVSMILKATAAERYLNEIIEVIESYDSNELIKRSVEIKIKFVENEEENENE